MATTGDGRAATAAGRWRGTFARMLTERHGSELGSYLRRRYEPVFGSGYRGRYGPDGALRDIEITEALVRRGGAEERPSTPPAATGAGDRAEGGGPPRGPLAMDLLRPPGADPRTFRFKLFHLGGPVHLSDSLPMLENMGLRVEDEHPRELRADGAGGSVWLHDFGLRQRPGPPAADLDAAGESFKGCFARVWSGEAEDDGFNRLALVPGLDWREIAMLRAYAKYLRQIRFGLSQSYMEDTLSANPDLVRDLVALFHARFDPARAAAPGVPPSLDESAPPEGDPPYAIAERILGRLEAVASLDEDRILRTYFELIDGTLRTNFHQRGSDGGPRPCLALKLDPSCVHEMPEPKPRFEIFVYSPRLEGVHLRGGPIARGGIRWSDRREDFRTEVLGLLKTQMVKNAVIVPVGSKGGFVLKRPPAERAALAGEGLACYREFVRGLLELTDNYEGSAVTHPPDTVRHDPDDPYLVVAADKGTATFSDPANELSAAAGFWLGDAFASGGSDGYDHKGIGITARGAWESVKSHFRVLGLDPAATAFTAVGIGDMSGDVFGNGMLCSRRIRLVAAFSHLHVFVDPDPDPDASYEERERLFRLPGSTWADYREDLISRGGGVWPRSAKAITLSPEALAALGVPGGSTARTPNDVIRAILRAPADLLWNGGIGTYVKAASESHSMVGDRSNDSVRINARELRCRVVAEGGNLGFTQAARVEYAQAGGLINTDAIDNSGGVDCSDHEVNIKILLDAAVRSGELDAGERSALLHSMTDEVAGQVLRNNYLQNVGLSVARTQAASLVEVHARFIDRLERTEGFDRAGEGLPDRDELAERRRAGEGLAGPELAVLVAYSKLDLFDALIGSGLPEDPEMAAELAAYFPRVLRRAVRVRHPPPPAGPRDHLDGGRERDGEPGRDHLRIPDLGRDRGDPGGCGAGLLRAPQPLPAAGGVRRHRGRRAPRRGARGRGAGAAQAHGPGRPVAPPQRPAAALRRFGGGPLPRGGAGGGGPDPRARDRTDPGRRAGGGGPARGGGRARGPCRAARSVLRAVFRPRHHRGSLAMPRLRRRRRRGGARDDGRGRRSCREGVVRDRRAPRHRLAAGADRGAPPGRPVGRRSPGGPCGGISSAGTGRSRPRCCARAEAPAPMRRSAPGGTRTPGHSSGGASLRPTCGRRPQVEYPMMAVALRELREVGRDG